MLGQQAFQAPGEVVFHLGAGRWVEHPVEGVAVDALENVVGLIVGRRSVAEGHAFFATEDVQEKTVASGIGAAPAPGLENRAGFDAGGTVEGHRSIAGDAAAVGSAHRTIGADAAVQFHRVFVGASREEQDSEEQ